jgi:hypothetical protein
LGNLALRTKVSPLILIVNLMRFLLKEEKTAHSVDEFRVRALKKGG